MSEKIGGAFPGGPSRRGSEGSGSSRRRLATVEQLEQASAKRSLRRARRQRRRRLVWVFAVSVAAAGATGLYLGFESHRTVEDARAAESAGADEGSSDAQISEEINRALLELWKMEDIEYLRNAR